jgi:tetratricopeptide (TPR) repeat protein
MSLINNMLKDLEKRDTHAREFSSIELIKLNSFRNKNKRIFTLSNVFIALTLILISLTSVILFRYINKSNIAPLPTQKTLSQPQTSSVNNDDIAWLQNASINGVTLQVKDNITEIAFLLDRSALYRLVSDAAQNRLSVIIENSHLQSTLPPVAYLNTALQGLSSQASNKDTKFVLSLVPGATIKYVNLSQSDHSAELVVAIEYQKVTQTAQRQSENSVKTPAMQNLITQQYQESLLSAETGNYTSAIEHLTSLLKIDPEFKDARVSLTALLIDQGNRSRAQKLIDDGLNTNPGYTPFIELKARILATDGKFAQALTLLQTSTPSIDENPEYHAFIAAMYEQTNKHALAANLYRQLIAINASNGSWWFGLGVSLDKLGQTNNAIAAYKKAAAEGHLNAESLAYLHTRMQKLQERIDD